MSTFLVIYNPEKRTVEHFEKIESSLKNGLSVEIECYTHKTKTIKYGDRIFLLWRGEKIQGIIGSGFAKTDVYNEGRNENVDNWIKVNLDAFINPIGNNPILSDINKLQIIYNNFKTKPEKELENFLKTRHSAIDFENADYLETQWNEHLQKFSIKKIDAQIVERQGQFRNKLLEAYNSRCAISGCTVEDVLEAAHISPYLGEHTNAVNNGILLRADIHTLFDRHLLSIDSNTYKVVISNRLQGTSYEELNGKNNPITSIEIPLSILTSSQQT